MLVRQGVNKFLQKLGQGPQSNRGVLLLEKGQQTLGGMEIELIQPIAMDQGLRFAIREGGRTVGAGVVTDVLK